MKQIFLLFAVWLSATTLANAQGTLTFAPLAALPGGGRYGMGYCQDVDAIYMVGGGGSASAFNADVYRYSLQSNSWQPGSASTTLTPQRWTSAAVPVLGTAQSYIYVLNGASAAGSPVVNMETVFTSNGTQGPGYANVLPASNAGVATWNGLLYAFGGQLAGGAFTSQLRAFDPVANTWTTLAPMPEAKTGYGAAMNGKIYAIGGYNGLINSARVDAYDIATNTWQALGTLPTTVSNQAVAVQGEWLWLVGDFTNQSYLAAYNTRTAQVRTFTSNLPPRRNAAAAFRNNRLYVWGGNTASANSSTLADMWSVDVSAVLGTHAEMASALNLHAYPNPSNGGLTTLTLPTGTRTVAVFDALGRTVLSVAPAANATTLPLDLRAQPAGLYVVRVRTANGRAASCRVVRE